MLKRDYNDYIATVREKEFPTLAGVTYLDHAGATLYCQSQLEAYHKELTASLFGNPHSHSESSQLTSNAIEETRDLVLSHFNTDRDTYSVVFTAGSTASLKLLAETFTWKRNPVKNTDDFVYLGDTIGENIKMVGDTESIFCYLEDDHTSVLGMREVAIERGASVVCFREQDIVNCETPCTRSTDPVFHLFAFPAQSNFSGRKYPLEWVNSIPSGKASLKGVECLQGSGEVTVLLDAASLVSTSPLDLTAYPADFVAVSFYKMFGFPTGLGALLVRNDRAELLQKSYFGGGTVSASISRAKFHITRPALHERLEDGTLAFLDIVALRHGYAALHRLGHSMESISHHTFLLAQATYKELARLEHYNGRPVCVLYHTTDFTDASVQGPIANFNLTSSTGAIIGFSEVDKLATVWKIHFRTGCFCNIGACQLSLGLTHSQLMTHIKAGHVCGDTMDLIDGIPTGSIRVSYGYMSTMDDVLKLISFVRECFQEKQPLVVTELDPVLSTSPNPVTMSCDTTFNTISSGTSVTVLSPGSCFSDVVLENIVLYPVKSCGCFQVSRWPIGDKGLLYDREWVIVKPSGNCLTMKEEPKLCLILPQLDLNKATLTLTAEGHPPLIVPIKPSTDYEELLTRVCSDRIKGIDCGEEAAQWISNVLQGSKQCRLVRQHPEASRTDSSNQQLSYTNQAQFLAVSTSSIELLCQTMNTDNPVHLWSVGSGMMRFRPNLVLSGRPPFDEDNWEEIHINRHKFEVIGKCTRCQMICVDPSSGERNTQPLVTLRQLRHPSKVTFGIYLALILTQ